MAIQVGDRLPSVTLKRLSAEGFADATTDEIFKGRRVLLFAVFGAFTPPCSGQHLPGYVAKAAEIKAKGIDEIACIAVNDPFTLAAWAKANNVGDKVTMLSDGNGTFTKAIGLEQDGTALACGTRSRRYAMAVDDGVVKTLNLEDVTSQVTVSNAEQMLKAL